MLSINESSALEHLMGELKEPSIASDILWRRIRNIIKVSAQETSVTSES
ncbi:hypothetical protein FK220_016920 [Flavobacteriaceae bacterium TP-CH-4]|uniref:Uncharacterized protein n=1 Tax=Pelagihabitans pacificus TaxID=2696054 RepID=A0A967E6Z2_9FLAO|nr:hypothetical protein [Pelagihabitans pacificus]NHF61037.1 hypothetical protein [Pelagihabitans pacificus]